MEEVVGLHGAKDAFAHGDLEIYGSGERGGFAGEVLPHAEVLCAPDDLLMEADEAGGDAACREGLLAGVDVGEQMDLNAAREVEAAVDGRVEDGGLFDADQEVPRRSNFERVQILRRQMARVKINLIAFKNA